MKEYIEREAFIEAKRKQYCADCYRRKGMKNGKMRFCYEIGEAPCRACYVDDLLTDVEDAPAADVVEVVRCKDCRYSREPNRHDRDENAACEGVLICCVGFDHVYPSAYDGLIFMGEDDYCSKGERREEVSE